MTLDCASRTMISSIVWFLDPPNRYNEAVLFMHFDGMVVVLTPTKAFGLGLPPLPSLAAGILFIAIPAISCNFRISFSMDPTEIFVNV